VGKIREQSQQKTKVFQGHLLKHGMLKTVDARKQPTLNMSSCIQLRSVEKKSARPNWWAMSFVIPCAEKRCACCPLLSKHHGACMQRLPHRQRTWNACS